MYFLHAETKYYSVTHPKQLGSAGKTRLINIDECNAPKPPIMFGLLDSLSSICVTKEATRWKYACFTKTGLGIPRVKSKIAIYFRMTAHKVLSMLVALTSQNSVTIQKNSPSTKLSWNLTMPVLSSLDRSFASCIASTVSSGAKSPHGICFSTFLHIG